jgi:hypothetical protein
MGRPVLAAMGIWLCVLGPGACKGDGSDDTGAPGNAPGEAEFPAQFAERFCRLTEECCTLSGGVFGVDCLAAEETRQSERADTAHAVGATYDAARAAECLEQLDSVACNVDEIGVVRGLLPACEVWRGHTAPGGACESATACDDSMPHVSASCGGGVCFIMSRLDPGMPCNPDDRVNRCDDLVSWCDEDLLKCVALPGPGETCLDDCRAGSWCDIDQEVCVELGSVGDACQFDEDCASDVCRAGQCASIIAGDSDLCELPAAP